MKKFLLLLALIPSICGACSGYVIGFMGKNNQFDHRAFIVYAKSIDYCYKVYTANQAQIAKQFILTLDVPYQLYGFSQGAQTITSLVKLLDNELPEYIITIGAYKTTDVNFSRYNIKFDNYFDYSGTGQKSPGQFVLVPHDKIQQEVNQLKNIR